MVASAAGTCWPLRSANVLPKIYQQGRALPRWGSPNRQKSIASDSDPVGRRPVPLPIGGKCSGGTFRHGLGIDGFQVIPGFG